VQHAFALRATTDADARALAALYRAAFPQEDLLPVVTRLLAEAPRVVSLAATAGQEFVGHVMLTPCRVGGAPGEVGLLAPLGVRPEWKRRGIGRALVGAAIAAARDAGMRRVLVLGDPAHYGRFGFAPEAAILPPYALPPGFAGAWQSLAPAAGVAAPAGPLLPPAAWLSPGLWGP
jgi:putative acetyltransferase